MINFYFLFKQLLKFDSILREFSVLFYLKFAWPRCRNYINFICLLIVSAINYDNVWGVIVKLRDEIRI